MKGNKPFKNTLSQLLDRNDLKWRWDILHLVNRAFEAARDEAGKNNPHSSVKLMSFIQGQSVTWRSGLEYTAMKLDALKSFKRPKIWSDTRMVNYEYDQLVRFVECSPWWDLPNWVDVLSRLYLPVTYVLKIILAKAQKTSLNKEWVLRVLCGKTGGLPDGLVAMKVSIDVAKAAIEGTDYSHIIDTMPDVIRTTSSPNGPNFSQGDFRKWMKAKKDLFVIDHLGIPITRNEANCDIQSMTDHLKNYVDILFAEIADRMEHSDKDGTTAWSEAPAESIFSVFKMVLQGRQSLSVGHTVALCRLVTNGPDPATVEAEELMKTAADEYPARNGLEFTTQSWQIRFISKLISQLKMGGKKAEGSGDQESDDDD